MLLSITVAINSTLKKGFWNHDSCFNLLCVWWWGGHSFQALPKKELSKSSKKPVAFEVGFLPAGLVSGWFPELDVFSKINSKQMAIQVSLGGGFNNCLFSPRKLGKMNPIWRAYFSDGLVQPTSISFWPFTCEFLLSWKTWCEPRHGSKVLGALPRVQAVWNPSGEILL